VNRHLFVNLKAFFSTNSQRIKFLSIVVIAIAIPLTVVAALAVQNLKQHAGGFSVVQIVDKGDNAISMTYDQDVFIDINLSNTNWVLPSQPSALNIKNGLVAKAYATDLTSPSSAPSSMPIPTDVKIPTPKPTCIQRGDANGNGVIDMGDVVKVNRIMQKLDPPTDSADANGDGVVDKYDITKIERIIMGQDKSTCVTTPTPSIKVLFPNGGETLRAGETYTISWRGNGLKKVTIALWASNSPTMDDSIGSYSAFAINPGLLDAAQGNYQWTVPAEATDSKSSLGWNDIGGYKYYKISIDGYTVVPDGLPGNFAVRDVSDNYFSIVGGSTPTPAPNILKAIYIENKDGDGSTGGTILPGKIMVKNGADIVRISWKLNKLLPGQDQALRTVQVTLIGDNAAIPFASTVSLKKSDVLQIPSRVDMSLFDCSGQMQIGQECHISALAYDATGMPIYKGVNYSWGISSTNTIGTLNKTNGNTISFYAKNQGTGNIWVLAQQGNIQVQKSIAIQVTSGTKPTPTPKIDTTQKLSRVELSLFNCTKTLQPGQECQMSALAYDTTRKPIFKNISYTWGISSTNSIGTLSKTVGNITGFYAKKAGIGDIWVLARQGNKQVQKSISIQVTAYRSADLNNDRVVNCKDMKILLSQYGKRGANLTADLNRDGIVNMVDYNILLRSYTPGQPTRCY
jgi:hypothetical protein